VLIGGMPSLVDDVIAAVGSKRPAGFGSRSERRWSASISW